MGHHELVGLVWLMRAKQKEYFRTRQPSVLNECRDLERRVDDAIDDSEDKTPAKLFEDAQ